MRKSLKIIMLALAIFLFVSAAVFAGGLSTRFVEVKLEDLELGKSYSVKEVTGKSLVVENTTDDVTVDIEIESEIPVDYNLVKGYEPIPELSWVKIDKAYFEGIGPGGQAETDITITIPEDEEHYGKKYQVYIYSHTAGDATFRTGLMSRLLLHISAKAEIPAEQEILEDKK